MLKNEMYMLQETHPRGPEEGWRRHRCPKLQHRNPTSPAPGIRLVAQNLWQYIGQVATLFEDILLEPVHCSGAWKGSRRRPPPPVTLAPLCCVAGSPQHSTIPVGGINRGRRQKFEK